MAIRDFADCHHPLMVHGSYANKSPNSRRALVLNVLADDTKADTGDVMFRGTDILVSKGEPMNEKHFPLLYPSPSPWPVAVICSLNSFN